jgi:hypothetical protein
MLIVIEEENLMRSGWATRERCGCDAWALQARRRENLASETMHSTCSSVDALDLVLSTPPRAQDSRTVGSSSSSSTLYATVIHIILLNISDDEGVRLNM